MLSNFYATDNALMIRLSKSESNFFELRRTFTSDMYRVSQTLSIVYVVRRFYNKFGIDLSF